MSKPSVSVVGVGKKFGLSLKSALKYGLIDSGRRLLGRKAEEQLRPDEFWALKDINFSLEPGDALGILGVNGSGKTTLLRILNGTFSPDLGSVTLRGSVGALIAAGAGFSPMLSGRENIYVSGALLGMSPAEIRMSFDEIVAFADLDEFIDMPVRNYSSGMTVRLGFAIAVIGRPDILLVDEVLAVGDVAFQKKCFEYIQRIRRKGTTIIFVSHSPGAIWAVCNKGLYLQGGEQGLIGDVESAIKAYDDYNSFSMMGLDSDSRSTPQDQSGLGESVASCLSFKFFDEYGENCSNQVVHGAPVIAEIVLRINKQIDNLVLRMTADSAVYKNVLAIDSYEQGAIFGRVLPGTYRFIVKFQTRVLRPGAYTFHLSVLDKHVGVHLFLLLNSGVLLIKNPATTLFYAEPLAVAHVEAQYSVREQSL